MKARTLCLLLAAATTGCAVTEAPPQPDVPSTSVAAFSANAAGATLPKGWRTLIINRTKKPTEYRLVRDKATGDVVVHARAAAAASGLRQSLAIDPAKAPVVAWRWRVPDLIIGADNQDRYSEDAPARLMLFFDGDRSALPLKERMLMETAKLVTGQDMPYSTLVYIWENRFPVGAVLPSSFTSQVKLVVAGSGPDARLGTWKRFERNYVEDYTRAFGRPPGRLIGIGIMTDTDNTGELIEAWYGDIEIRPARRKADGASRPVADAAR